MPHINRIRVSRKIEDDEHRRRLREIFSELKPPRGLGFIIRTAAIDKNKKELQRDLAYLSRLWQVMVRRIKKMQGAGRDLPGKRYDYADDPRQLHRPTSTPSGSTTRRPSSAPRSSARSSCRATPTRIKLYDGKEPLFHKYGIEEEIHKIQQRKVPLPFGGSIVIEQTEALVAIDVNSGNFRADRQDAEETAYQMNLQAAKEIARQLRLRDLTRRHRQRLHRHARRDAPRAASRSAFARRPDARPGADQDPQDLRIRPDRDDAAADAAVAEAQRLPGLPALPRHGPGQDVREHEPGGGAAVAAGGVPRAGAAASRCAWRRAWPTTCSTGSGARSPGWRRAASSRSTSRACRGAGGTAGVPVPGQERQRGEGAAAGGAAAAAASAVTAALQRRIAAEPSVNGASVMRR